EPQSIANPEHTPVQTPGSSTADSIPTSFKSLAKGEAEQLLLDTGLVDIDTKDSRLRQTPLSLAAENGFEKLVQLLLKIGPVNTDTKDSRLSHTPLSSAAETGHEQGAKQHILLCGQRTPRVSDAPHPDPKGEAKDGRPAPAE